MPYSARLAACFASGWGCLTKASWAWCFTLSACLTAIWFNPAAVVKWLGMLTLIRDPMPQTPSWHHRGFCNYIYYHLELTYIWWMYFAHSTSPRSCSGIPDRLSPSMIWGRQTLRSQPRLVDKLLLSYLKQSNSPCPAYAGPRHSWSFHQDWVHVSRLLSNFAGCLWGARDPRPDQNVGFFHHCPNCRSNSLGGTSIGSSCGQGIQ